MVVGGRLGRGEEWEKIGTTLIEQQQKKESFTKNKCIHNLLYSVSLNYNYVIIITTINIDWTKILDIILMDLEEGVCVSVLRERWYHKWVNPNFP